jgi:hypothetical protein
MTKNRHANDRMVVAYTAGTAAEAMVVRGLLESAGIHSPDFDSADPFPLNEPPEGAHGAEVYVMQSQEAEARRVIAEHLQGNASANPDE